MRASQDLSVDDEAASKAGAQDQRAGVLRALESA